MPTLKTCAAFIAAVVVVVGAMSTVFLSSASAAPGGRALNYGYFTNNYINLSGPGFTLERVIQNGIAGHTGSKADFISYLKGLRSGTDSQDKTGAQFLIQMMRGHTDYSRPTDSDVSDWENRINNPNITFSTGNITDDYNSGYSVSDNDDTFYTPNTPVSYEALIIKNNGVTVFTIKLLCGNPLGNYPGLPVAGWNLSGSSTVSDSSAYPGQTVTFSHYLSNSGPLTATTTDTPQHNYNGAIGNVSASAVDSIAVGAPKELVNSNAYTVPATAANDQLYCQHIHYTDDTGPGTSDGNGPQVCTKVQSAYVDGYKATPGGGYQQVDRGVAASSTYPFSDDAISAHNNTAGTTQTTDSDAFYFDNCINGTNCGNTGTYNTSLAPGNYTFSHTDAGSTVDASWKFKGITICKDSSTTAANAAWTGPGYKLCSSTTAATVAYLLNPANVKATSSFTLANNQKYHMRFLYVPINHHPTGTLNFTCTLATATYSDADGGTYANLFIPATTTTSPDASSSSTSATTKTFTFPITSLVDGTTVRLFVNDKVPPYGEPAAADFNLTKTKPNCSPKITGLVAICDGNISGSTYDQSNPTAAVAITIKDNTTGRSTLTPVSANPNFSVPIASFDNPYQDGKDHVFIVTAKDTDGNPDTAAPVTMTGCGAFTITVVPAGSFDPSDEAPTKFTTNNQVNVAYPGWSISGPSIKNTSNTSTLSLNGAPISPTCPVASLTNNGAIVPATYNYCVNIATPVAGDIYCTNITATPQNGIVDRFGNILSSSGTATANPPACATVNNKPFFKVYNSSVSTGGDVGKCTNDVGVLSGFFNNVDPANGYGASAQLGAYALSDIFGFASNQTFSNRVPTGLSFANAPASHIGLADRVSAHLGGKLAGQRCITGLAEAPLGTPPSFEPSGKINLTPIFNGSGTTIEDLTATPNNIELTNPGDKLVTYNSNVALYINGDVYITKNIAYDLSGWTRDSVPSFVLSVKGNIYIDPSVTQLDGNYQATGSIYTCAANNSGTFAPVSAGNLYSQCNNQLTVTGSFIAKKLNLLRTFGSLRNDATGPPTPCSNLGTFSTTHTTCAAEVFEFSPEQYLANPATKQSGGGAIQYDAITSLPPVL